ncbi:TPA: restriction endonuclease subunit S [Enterococcus faecium]|nr:restriction endonuclease subunit S [Enterococcus faecium]
MSNDKQPEIRFPEFTEAWEQRKLASMTNYKNGKGHEDKQSTIGKFELINLNSISISGGLKHSGKFIDEADDTLQKDDLVMILSDVGHGDLLGRVALIPEDDRFVLNQRVALLRPNATADPQFLFSYINAHQYYFKAQGAGMSQLNISKGSVENFISFVPIIEEQKKIGTFFKQLDDTIALHQRKLDLLKETKKGFLQKMFPKNGAKVPEIRFPGFTEDWEERKLGDMMDVTSVKRIHQSDWTNSGIRFLRARDIVSAAKNEEPSDYLYISEEKYNEYSKISGKVSQGDLLVTGVGSIGVPLLITDDNPIYFKDGNIIWFKNEHKIDGNFFYYSFINNKIQKYIRDVAGIGTVGTYTIDSGKKTPISLPTYDEQIKIGSFFKQFDHTIMLHQHELDLLKETKKGFLQKMFV